MAAAAQSQHGESAREQGKHVPFKDHDKTIMKVSSFTSPRGPHGEKYLASAKRCVGHCACAVMRMHHSHCVMRRVSMRLWENEQPAERKPESVREYEVVGYGTQ